MTEKTGSRRAIADADAAEVQIMERNHNVRDDVGVIDQHDIDQAAREVGLKIAQKYLAGQEYDLQQLTAEINVHFASMATAYVEIGRKLIIIKQVEGHGGFTKWLEKNFPFSPQYARKFMRVAMKLERDPELLPLAKGCLPKALRLLDLPEDDLEEFKEEGTLYGKPLEDWQLKTSKELAAELEKERKSREKIIAEETKGLKAENEALVKQNKDLQKFVPTDDPSPEWSLKHVTEITKAVLVVVSLAEQFVNDDRLKDDKVTQAKIEQQLTIARKVIESFIREWDEQFNPAD